MIQLLFTKFSIQALKKSNLLQYSIQMLDPESPKQSYQPKTIPLNLFATFSPLIPSSHQQKTLRMPKQSMQRLAENQTITESQTFIEPPLLQNFQEKQITLKNICRKSNLIKQNSLKIDNTSSSLKKQQNFYDHTKLEEGQPQLFQILSSLKINKSSENGYNPYKKTNKQSTVQIQLRDQAVEFGDSQDLGYDNTSNCRRIMLSLTQTVSIVFVPAEKQRKAPFLSQKMAKKSNQIDDYSLLSHESSNIEQSSSGKAQMPFLKPNLIHLNEISLLLHKDQQKNERLNELRHANQKMLNLFLSNKEQLDQTKKEMEKIKQCFLVLQRELEKERQERISILAEKEQKEGTIRLLKELNERYLKDNNEIKEKLKTYLRSIHELKLQLSQKQQKQHQSYLRSSQTTLNLNLDTKTPKNIQKKEIIHPMTTKNGRSYLDISQNIPTQKNSVNGFNKVIAEQKTKKINNSYSIPQFQNIKKLQKQLNEGQQGAENIYSYRNVALTPNFFTQMTEQDEEEPKFGSRGRKININSIPQRRSTLKLGKQQQGDKSLSGFSNLSGISASQKIGYIVKPRKENNLGEIIDYLQTENADEARTFRTRNMTAWNINRNS